MSYKKILFRRDTAANWTSANPVLSAGEIGLESDTEKIKLGDGSTAWSSLDYFYGSIDGVVLNDLHDVVITSAANGDFLRWNGTAWVNDAVNLSTDTIGDFVQALVAGTGITITNNSGENATPTVAVTANTYDAYGSASYALSTAATALSNHESDTTNIHGIADTSILVTTTGEQTLTNKTITSPSGLVKGDVGLGNVDNTSDANKPISTATQNALDLKAPLDSPTFTGTVTLPDNTVALGTKTTGNYVASLVAGTGVTLTNNSGESATPTVAIGQAVDTSSSVTFADVNVTGNLTVSGTATTVNTETLSVADNVVVLNNNVTGAPTENGGIEIERGTSANVQLRWNETSDKWEITEDGTNYENIATETYAASLTPSSLDEIGDVNITSVASGDFLRWNGTDWVNDPINLGTDTTGNYMSDVTAGTGVTVTHTPGEGSSATVAIGQAVGTSDSPQFTGVNVGHATDTTITRVSAGRIAVEGVNVVTTSSSDTLSNKSIALGSNTVTGTKAQFDTAVTDDNFAYTGTANAFTASQTVTGTVTAQAASTQDAVVLQGRAGGTSSRSVTITPASLTASRTLTLPDATTTVVGTDTTQTLTNKTLTNPIISSISNSGTITIPTGFETLVGRSTADTLYNKTIDFGGNTITASIAQLNSALSDGDVATLDGYETLTNKTYTNPILSGTLTAGGSTGTSGYFLKTTGTGVTWAAAAPATTTTTVSTTAATEIYSFSTTDYEAADLAISVTQGSKKTALKTFVSHDGSSNADVVNTSKIEYGSPVIPLTVTATVASVSGVSTWTSTGAYSVSLSGQEAVRYINSTWVIVGPGNNSGTGIATSTDLTTWTSYASTNFSNNQQIRDIAYGNGVWVAVGGGSYSAPQLATSTDLTTWTSQTHNFGNNSIRAVAYGNGIFVAGGRGYGGLIRTSTDGTTWTTRTSVFSSAINTIVYGNGLWVGGDDMGIIATSTDAVTWVTRTQSANYRPVNDVRYGAGIWVAGSDGGLVTTSTDAVTWTTRSHGWSSNYDLQSLEYGSSVFVATVAMYDNSSGISTSTDGITWTTRAWPLSSSYNNRPAVSNALAYGNGYFVSGTSGIQTLVQSGQSSTNVSVTAAITDANSTSATVKVLPAALVEA